MKSLSLLCFNMRYSRRKWVFHLAFIKSAIVNVSHLMLPPTPFARLKDIYFNNTQYANVSTFTIPLFTVNGMLFLFWCILSNVANTVSCHVYPIILVVCMMTMHLCSVNLIIFDSMGVPMLMTSNNAYDCIDAFIVFNSPWWI